MICVDGGSGLLAVNKVRKADDTSVKADLHAVMNADTAMKARSAARGFAERWGQAYPATVACLRDDLDELVTCFRYKTLAERKAVRTTNAIERRFREVRRRTRPMGVFEDRTSMDRILFAVFAHSSPSSPTKTKCRESRPFSP
jgi:transposase-like protein